MEPITLAALSTLTWKIVSVVKYLTNKDWRAALTQVVVWGAGVLVMFLAAAADVTAALSPIAGVTLGDMDGWSLALLGLGIASLGSVGYDFKRSFDNTDSATEPPLPLGSSGP